MPTHSAEVYASPRPGAAQLMPAETNSSSTPRLRCVLIGADTLLEECAKILLAEGHDIAALICGSARIADFAAAHSIVAIDGQLPTGDWITALEGSPFDWLLAVTHLALLPDDVLALPARGAINFHDGPLPGYGGINAPAWAIMRGEQEHGITWHLLTSGIDEGDVVVESSFQISPDETSLSLNTKNFAAAIESFTALVALLASQEVAAKPQDPAVPRSTFSRHDRPAAMGSIDWRRPAREIDRLVRALDFGPYANPLGRSRFWVGDTSIIVTSAEPVDAPAGTPGLVIECSSSRVVVACGEGAIALTGFISADGSPMSAAEVSADLSSAHIVTLPTLDDTTLESLTHLGRELSQHERFHVARLEALAPVELPWALSRPPAHVATPREIPLELSATTDDSVLAALATVIARLSGRQVFQVAFADHRFLSESPKHAASLMSTAVPLTLSPALTDSFEDVRDQVCAELANVRRHGTFALDLVGRVPALRDHPELSHGRLLPIAFSIDTSGPLPEPVVELNRSGKEWRVRFDRSLLSEDDARLLARCIERVHGASIAEPAVEIRTIDMLGPDLRHTVLDRFNETRTPVRDVCIHHLLNEQALRTPHEIALVHANGELTYGELDDRANELALRLSGLGVGPDQIVGVHLPRGPELVIALIAVLKSGGAYLPLDPAYPRQRLLHMVEDSGCAVILAQSAQLQSVPLPLGSRATVVGVDLDTAAAPAGRAAEWPRSDVTHANLAYCIYTSGSTGLPKGVLVEHRNVVNFFTAMDQVVDHELPATWLAVTSPSFDISVLELLYTLTRGFRVVLQGERASSAASGFDSSRVQPIDFSLFYFSGEEAESAGADKYRLLLEGAKWADTHDFAAVWTPERHFHAFGGLYPQPAITGAAVAAITNRVSIRAGSVVMPLHHPIRVAEAWSVVDNLSNGRVGISVASGWQPNDFVLAPQNYSAAKEVMFESLGQVQRLWRGEAVAFPGVDGTPVEVVTLPRPVQPELPIWVTAAGNPETYVQAGRIGANVLTHLLGQSIDELAPKIEAYRAARSAAGFDAESGTVTLMLHTFVGSDRDSIREIVRDPLKQYLASSLSLLGDYAGAFPAFRRPVSGSLNWRDDDFSELADDERDALLEYAFQRYYESSGLFGTPSECKLLVEQLKCTGVTEIACLIDFGVSTEIVLDSLRHLDELRRQCNPDLLDSTIVTDSFASQIKRHQVTHLQCTPSMARALTMDPADRAALEDIRHLYIGGEIFPSSLANDLHQLGVLERTTNMYGPTETTIWSATWRLDTLNPLNSVPVGRPVSNTTMYVLDSAGMPQPPGVPGVLWVGGAGVARGYHQRPELTSERFVVDPFRNDGSRMYHTGDMARWRVVDGHGVLEFLGRADNQVKIRGYRVELGEVEAAIERCEVVRECAAVVVHDSNGEQILVAYVAGDVGLDVAAIKSDLRVRLPDVMVPGHLVVLPELPHTPNGKIDRGSLPWPVRGLRQHVSDVPLTPASSDAERLVLEVWQEVLEIDDIGVTDNFFDIGGHSLLVVRLHRRLRDRLPVAVSLTDLYRFPTVRSLTKALADETEASSTNSGVDRAAKRREVQRRRSRA